MKRNLALALLVAVSLLIAGPAGATFKGKNGRLAFMGMAHDDSDPDYEPNDGTDLEIWTVRPDGTRERNVTADDADQGAPLFSPDGRLLLFHCHATGTYHASICVMRVDGTKRRRLTGSRVGNYAGSWSPDGKQIVYSRIGAHANDSDIWKMDADGSDKTKLTEGRGNEREPAWSPNGKLIVFVGDRDGDNELFVMRADGTHVRRLTDNRANDASPDWAPGGTWIVYVFGDRRGFQYDIHLLNVKTGVRRKIYTEGLGVQDPVWSPDGTKIAFADGGNYDIYVMRRDGTHIRRVTNSQREDLSPSWQPLPN